MKVRNHQRKKTSGNSEQRKQRKPPTKLANEENQPGNLNGLVSTLFKLNLIIARVIIGKLPVYIYAYQDIRSKSKLRCSD